MERKCYFITVYENGEMRRVKAIVNLHTHKLHSFKKDMSDKKVTEKHILLQMCDKEWKHSIYASEEEWAKCGDLENSYFIP